MITFGKKMNYWPLFFSIFWALFVFPFALTLFQTIGVNAVIWSLGVSVAVFLFVSGIYYPTALQYDYSYYEIYANQIRYYDFSTRLKKFEMIFLGPNTPMKSLNMDQVEDAKTFGKSGVEKLPSVALFDPIISLPFLTKVSVIKNPYGIELELDGGQKEYISSARDKVYDNRTCTAKTKAALDLIQKSIHGRQLA
ncbi:hypothetical protein F5ESL0263_02165 [Lactobacillus sp. ESL0263]|uniref:hypothetical protein n=1 Tax=Lactobacillus sp. ESL0263 TaxID=2069350 RepID=UPI000EFA7287|nr:hypothetical protein [Lactobacillus sp. ESL0263]RMC49840.1 hypothetical protein F5ESL0263_02165 [Lactobacillus sp. ESL0263]